VGSKNDITELLQAWRAGDDGARERLMPLVYDELRRRASACLRRERDGHTLQPTALVHETYLRLADQNRAVWQNRGHFFGVATQMMRRVLVDYARRRNSKKRSGRWTRVTLGEGAAVGQPMSVDILDLDAALTELAAFDEGKSRIVELRFFGGLSLEETAHVLDVSPSTIEREWQTARAWLYRSLSGRADA
jgi:RNA polymerase sigma factor (TIGR02999 family)